MSVISRKLNRRDSRHGMIPPVPGANVTTTQNVLRLYVYGGRSCEQSNRYIFSFSHPQPTSFMSSYPQNRLDVESL